MIGSHRVAEGYNSKDFKQPNGSIEAVLRSTCHKMQLHQCVVSLVVISCQLSACPDKLEPFKNHPITCGHQTGSKRGLSKSKPLKLLAMLHT